MNMQSQITRPIRGARACFTHCRACTNYELSLAAITTLIAPRIQKLEIILRGGCVTPLTLTALICLVVAPYHTMLHTTRVVS